MCTVVIKISDNRYNFGVERTGLQAYKLVVLARYLIPSSLNSRVLFFECTSVLTFSVTLSSVDYFENSLSVAELKKKTLCWFHLFDFAMFRIFVEIHYIRRLPSPRKSYSDARSCFSVITLNQNCHNRKNNGCYDCVI